MTVPFQGLVEAGRKFAAAARQGIRVPRSPGLDALHVFVLSSFAVAQPVYDRLGDRGAFLVDLGIRPAVVLLSMALVSLALPGFFVLLEALARRCGRTAADSLHALTVFALLLLIWLPIFKRALLFTGPQIFAAALVTAGLTTSAYFSFRRVRDVVTVASPGILIFPAVFLFHSSVTSYLLSPPAIRVARFDPVPVVMVVFDELCGASLMTPERQIDADRFPNFAALARDAAWFRNATSVQQETWRAVPAILSGEYPRSTWPPLPTDLPQNLFSVIDSTGAYELALFEPVSNLAPLRHASRDPRLVNPWRHLAELFDALARVLLFHVTPEEYYLQLPMLPKLWFGLRETEQIDRAARRGVFRYPWGKSRDEQFRHFLDTIDGSPAPSLHFMHVLLPHVPWCYLPSGGHNADDAGAWELLNVNTHSGLVDYWGHDELIVMQSEQRYILQLQYVDRLIGELVERLRKAGVYDRCLLVIAADHGVSFRTQQPRRETSDRNLADILSIPLFVKRPGEASGGVNDRRVEIVDILPTVADVLGIELRRPTDGWSVFNETRPDRTVQTYYFDGEPRSVSPTLVADSDVPHLLRKRFGDSRDPQALYRIGPIPELIGRRVEDLTASGQAEPPGAAPAFELELFRYGDTLTDDPQPLVPCYFEGLVRNPVALSEPLVLAVAINGVIRSVTRTFLLEGIRDRWAALVPEDSFHRGPNDVQFYAVTGDSPHWQLTPCVKRLKED